MVVEFVHRCVVFLLASGEAGCDRAQVQVLKPRVARLRGLHRRHPMLLLLLLMLLMLPGAAAVGHWVLDPIALTQLCHQLLVVAGALLQSDVTRHLAAVHTAAQGGALLDEPPD